MLIWEAWAKINFSNIKRVSNSSPHTRPHSDPKMQPSSAPDPHNRSMAPAPNTNAAPGHTFGFSKSAIANVISMISVEKSYNGVRDGIAKRVSKVKQASKKHLKLEDSSVEIKRSAVADFKVIGICWQKVIVC